MTAAPKRRGTPAVADDPERADHVAAILRAVAHPLRLRIVAILAEGEATVTALARRLEAGQPAVSQQLGILRAHRLVAVSREGGFARYRLEEQNLRGLLGCMERCRR